MPDPILKAPAAPVAIVADPAGFGAEFERGAEAAFAGREVTAKELKEVIAPAKTEPKANGEVEHAEPKSRIQDPSDFKPGTKAEQWSKLKESKKAAEGEVESYKKQIEDLRTKLSSQPKSDDLEALKRERDEAVKDRNEIADRLKSVAIERHPETEKKYNARMQSALELGKAAVTVDQADRVAKLLVQPDSEARTAALDEILESSTPMRRARLERAIIDVDSTFRDYREEVQNSRQNWAKIQEQKSNEQNSVKSQREEALNSVLAQWSDKEKGLAIFNAEDAEGKSAVQGAKSLARDMAVSFESFSPVERAKASAWAAAAPLILRDNLAKTEHIAKLEAELEGLRSGHPGGDVSGASEQPEGGEKKDLSWDNFGKEIDRLGLFPSR